MKQSGHWVKLYLVFACVCYLPSLQGSKPNADCPCADPSLCDRVTVGDRQEVVGYTQDLTHYAQYNWTKLTTVVLYERFLDRVGVDVVCLAHSHKVRAIIAVSITPDQMRNATGRGSVIKYYTNLAEKYYLDGANIDVEFSTADPGLRQGLTDLVNEVKTAFSTMHPSSLVVVDVPWYPDSNHDTRALADASDILFIMGYDEQTKMLPPCVAAANAPLLRTEVGVSAFLAMGVPGHKLVLGSPWYGRFYNCTELDNDICHITRMKEHCTQLVSREVSFGMIMRYPDAKTERKWSQTYQSPFRNLKDNVTGAIHQIWYDDPESLLLKYQLAINLGLRGVGMWNTDSLDYTEPLGVDTLAMWNTLPDF